MSLRNPSQFWRKVIVGSVYGGVGVMAGLLLGLIPETIIVLMVIGGLFGIWIGSRMESEPRARQDISNPCASTQLTDARRPPESR